MIVERRTIPLWPNNDWHTELVSKELSCADRTECIERDLKAHLLEAMAFVHNEDNDYLSSTHVTSKTCSVTPGDQMYLLSIFFMWLEKKQPSHCDITKADGLNWFLKEVPKYRPHITECLERAFPDPFSRVYIMSKQRILSTGIIVAWTPAIYICPEWMRKAPLMSKVPAPPHHPSNLCYLLLWWTICWSHYRWWFRMYCLINKLHIQPCNPAWTWRTKSSTVGMVTYIKYVHFLC